MDFPVKYNLLGKNEFSQGENKIVPIRYEDRFAIMKWRNEQIYHLRQGEPLTELGQENYFVNIVSALFEQRQPGQILFSYLEGGQCIGYGGLVHINWKDKNAELSFIMDTALEKKYFKKHWGIYLDLIEQVAFDELKLHKLYTYAFDLRQHLYDAVEAKGYKKEAELKEHYLFEGVYKDVIIHSKIRQNLTIRVANEADEEITFEWANDELTRRNSFSTDPIPYMTHKMWWDQKIQNNTYYIIEVNNKPAGLIRFDIGQNEVIIGITIAPGFRGKNLSSKFLKLACAEFLKRERIGIIAYIKRGNTVSIKAFEKAGFKFIEEVNIKDQNALKYQYT